MAVTRRSPILRWLKRIGLGLVALVSLAIICGAGFEAIARHQARINYPPRGRMIDIGGRRIHLDCRGQGSPTVVFEAGLDTNGSLAWSAVQDQVAAKTRACAYDRAGVMWSDPKRTPQNADAVAEDLHATLAAAGEKAPLVMVGHSLGGPYILDYTRKYGPEVAGLVFVDASHPDQFKRYKAAGYPADAAPLAFRAMVALTWIGWTRIPTHPDLPPHVPPATIAASNAYMSVSLPAALTEAEALNQSVDQAGQIRSLGPHPLGDRPLVVLTGAQPLPDKMIAAMKMTRPRANQYQAMWKSLHDDETTWSTHSRHQIVADSSHYIQFYRPDIVIAAVDEVVDDVRAKSPPAKP